MVDSPVSMRALFTICGSHMGTTTAAATIHCVPLGECVLWKLEHDNCALLLPSFQPNGHVNGRVMHIAILTKQS